MSSCVGVLVENKRLGHLAKMTADYAKLIAADRDELVATVTTAVVRAEFLLLPQCLEVVCGGEKGRPHMPVAEGRTSERGWVEKRAWWVVGQPEDRI